jgi:HNH endonuclease
MPRIYGPNPQAREAGKFHKAKAFECYWIPEPNTGCWLWLGPMYANGYGYYSEARGRKPRNVSAHAASWERYRGPIPAGHEPHHTCSTRLCINPDHLEIMERSAHKRLHANERRNLVTGQFKPKE